MYPKLIKPVTDYLTAVLLLVATSWVFLLVSVILKMSRDGSVFFRQQRSGKNGRPFTILKFRTLRSDTSLPVEQRRTRFGDFLRATSLDELPQLLNILRGEMSLIGPRPLPVEYWPLMKESQQRRNDVLPGITGLTQVNDRHTLSWQKKFELDLLYVQTISFRLDMSIVIKTLFVVLSFKKDISLREKPFTGY